MTSEIVSLNINNENNDAVRVSPRVPKKRGRPPKIATQQTAYVGITNAPLVLASTQPAIVRREGLRSHRKNKYQIN